MDIKFRKYRRTNIAEMSPVTESLLLSSSFPWPSISVSDVDKENGSPKIGDMIARNPENHDDKWLVAEEYFKNNFEEIPSLTK